MAALPRIMQTTATFFAADLPKGTVVQPAETRTKTPLEIVVGLLKQLNMLMAFEPKAECCHFVELEVTAGRPEERVHATVRFIRGTGNHFLLQARLPLPDVGEVLLGHGDHPWLCTRGKVVFVGNLHPDEAGDGPLAYVDPDHKVRAQVVAGALAGVAIAPEVLEQFISIADASPAEGPRTLHLESKKDKAQHARLVVSDDGRSPQALQFDIENTQGTVEFRSWQINTPAHAGMFDPPEGVPVQEVDRRDLYRMYSAMFNFAMENAQ
jgi:hypothetical protein